MKIIHAGWDNGEKGYLHGNATLKEVLAIYTGEEYKEKKVSLVLERWDEGIYGIGHVFVKKATIGNVADNLTLRDYFAAYDQLF